MTQNYDVTLAGNGYMLVPPPERPGTAVASYRLNVTPFKPVSVRAGIRDWLAPVSAHDETRWRSDSFVPELSGYGTVRGLVLGPAVRATAIFTNQIAAWAVMGGVLYISTGVTLAKVTLTGGLNISGVAVVGTTAGAITGMFVSTGRLYLALAAPATSYASTDGVTITAAPGTVVGTQGFGYANGTWLVSRTSPNTLAASIDGGATWSYFAVEGAIRSVLTTGRAVLIFHAAGVDELTGAWVTTTTGGTTTTSANFLLAPLVHTTAAGTFGDYYWAVDFNGQVHTWFGGTVCVLDRSTITGGRLVAVDAAPRGGPVAAVVSGGRLWVAVQNSQYELWSSDGARWVRHLAGGPLTIALLASLAGIAFDADVLLFQTGTNSAQALLTQSLSHTAYPAVAGVVVGGPWDAGTPDDAKTWTEVEVGYNVPDRAAAPSGSVQIETSVNGGTTYANAGTTPITSGTGGTIRVPLAGVSGEMLTVRVTWTPTANGVGFRLVSVYANGWELSAAPATKRWSLRLRCSDKLLRRDGSVDVRTGEAMRAALIGLAAGAPVAYADLDYDANPITQTVRVVEVDEASRRGDGTHFWESEMAVTLEAIT